jgi:hypothetical protein
MMARKDRKTMREKLEIIGYLNLYGRDVTPIALDAIFRQGDRRFLCRGEAEVLLSDDDIENYEADSFIQWVAPLAVPSTAGRFLYHEDATEVASGKSMPCLTFSYLAPTEEFALRTQLAMAYLDRADHALRAIRDTAKQEAFQSACALLERVARARPDFITARVIKAIIASEFDDDVGVETELAEIEFEWTRLGTKNWKVLGDRHSPIYERNLAWKRFEVGENSLAAFSDSYPLHKQADHETIAKIDALAISVFEKIGEWVTPGNNMYPYFWPYRNLLFTIALLDLVGTHQRFATGDNGGVNWRTCLIAFSRIHAKALSLSAMQGTYSFWLWRAEIVPMGATFSRSQNLCDRLLRIYADICLPSGQSPISENARPITSPGTHIHRSAPIQGINSESISEFPPKAPITQQNQKPVRPYPIAQQLTT